LQEFRLKDVLKIPDRHYPGSLGMETLTLILSSFHHLSKHLQLAAFSVEFRVA
jgi:hypothetical protein